MCLTPLETSGQWPFITLLRPGSKDAIIVSAKQSATGQETRAVDLAVYSIPS